MMKKLSMAIAAFVIAGTVAVVSGFISTQAVHAAPLAKNAVEIQVAQAAAPTAAPAAAVPVLPRAGAAVRGHRAFGAHHLSVQAETA